MRGQPVLQSSGGWPVTMGPDGFPVRDADAQLQLLQVLTHWERLEHVVAGVNILHHLVDFGERATVKGNASEQGGLDETEIVLRMHLVTRRHEVTRLKRNQMDVDGVQRVQAGGVHRRNLLDFRWAREVLERLKVVRSRFQWLPAKDLVDVVEAAREGHSSGHCA